MERRNVKKADVFERWRIIVSALTVIHRMFNRIRRAQNSSHMLEHLYPATYTMLNAMIATPTASATVPHSRMPPGATYPETPETCEHPPMSMYRYGNARGRFRECRECGQRWVVCETIDRSIWRREILLWEETIPRLYPGAQIRGANKASSSSSSTLRSSSGPQSSKADPKASAKPTRTSPSTGSKKPTPPSDPLGRRPGSNSTTCPVIPVYSDSDSEYVSEEGFQVMDDV